MSSLRIEIPGRVLVAELPTGPVRVGRGEECELRLDCPGLSAAHFLVEPLPDGRHKVKDLQSGAATRVNGIPVQQVSLQPGDVIEAGEARIHYAPQGAPATAAAAPPASAAVARPAAPPRAASASRSHPSHRRVAVLASAIGGAGVLVALLAIVFGGGGSDAARAKHDLERAETLARAQENEAARAIFARLAADRDGGETARTAERWLQSLDDAEQDARADLDRLAAGWKDFDLGGAAARRAILVQRHGEAFGPRFDAAVQEIRGKQDAWARRQGDETAAAAKASLDAGRYGEALATWKHLRELTTRDDLRGAAADGLTAVEAAAKTEADSLIAAADRASRAGNGKPAEALRAALPRFAGTAAEADLLARAKDLEAAAVRAKPVVSPTAPAAAPTPAPSAAVKERAASALRDADAAAKERRFADAVAALDAVGVSSLPAGRDRDAFAARRDDLDLARAGLEAIVADVRANPARYAALPLAGTVGVSLIDADLDGVTGAVAGGKVKHRWASLDPARIGAIGARWRGDAAGTIAIAALLHEVGATEAYEVAAARLPEDAPERQRLFPLLARWRGEAAPAAGYVLFEGRWRTPEERDRLVLEAKVRDAVQRLDARDAPARKKAVDELLGLGEAARPALLGALKARRERLEKAIVSDKVFVQTKTRQRLFDELEKRRREALALIQDSARYPYPSETHVGQEQVNGLVDRVREVWETPFDLVAEWDQGVKEGLASITEVDEAISRADSSYRPTFDALREAASAQVDLPSFVPASYQSLREYSVRVLAYNDTVATSATPQERDNILAVNEYRIMMGRRPLKINERLVRTARGHSRWMREHEVFAHEINDPERRTPGDRAKRQGYLGGVGENIARGVSSGREAFDAWFHSSGHHRNMLGEGWTEMGAGRSGELWWTQNFGAASQLSLVQPEALPPPNAEVAPEPEGPLTPHTPGAPQVPNDTPPPPGDDPKAPGGG